MLQYPEQSMALFNFPSCPSLQDPRHNLLLTEGNPKLHTAEGARKIFLKGLWPCSSAGNGVPRHFGCSGSEQSLTADALFTLGAQHVAAHVCG